MSQPLSGILNVLPDGIPTVLEEAFGFKQSTLFFLFSSNILSSLHVVFDILQA